MPISAFAHALRSFQSGDLTQDELSWEIDRQLAIEKTSPIALLEILEIQQVTQPLPDAAHEAIVHHLQEWPQDPTIVTGLPRSGPSQRPLSCGVGDILQGRFSLVALIGAGGMSRVFKAIDLRRVEAGAPDPYVALKVLTEPLSDYFGSIVALQRETHKLEQLAHPNIVRVIDCDRDGLTVFMTMEYLSGMSLQRTVRTTEAAALSLVATIGGALQYAHDHHIVHGDLKPANVIVTDKGVIKVIDFGMARFIARPDEKHAPEPKARATPKAVTPRYASPEMVAGQTPEPADDVYALACIAYELLSGQHPFGPETGPRARDPAFVPPRPPQMRRHHYAALVKALAFDRRQRTATAAQFMEQLLVAPLDRLKRRWRWGVALLLFMIGVATYEMIARRRADMAVRPTADGAAGSAFVVIPAGRFTQGSAASSSEYEAPRHGVLFRRAFAMSSKDVTVGEFGEFAAATQRAITGCEVYDGRWQYRQNADWRAPGFAQTATHPVTCVSWDDATAYASWLSKKSGQVYRLPSASEWEYAARAGSERSQPWADNPAAACSMANVADQQAGRRYPGWSVFPCNDGHVYTAPVGSFSANAVGLYDMLGNVFQWVQDCWHDNYADAPVDGSPRLDGSCEEHEMRGGSWYSLPQFVTVTYRNRFGHAYRSSSVGFRLVKELDK